MEPKKWTDAHIEWVMEWYEVDREAAIRITKCDDGTATQWAFKAGMEYEGARIRESLVKKRAKFTPWPW